MLRDRAQRQPMTRLQRALAHDQELKGMCDKAENEGYRRGFRDGFFVGFGIMVFVMAVLIYIGKHAA